MSNDDADIVRRYLSEYDVDVLQQYLRKFRQYERDLERYERKYGRVPDAVRKPFWMLKNKKQQTACDVTHLIEKKDSVGTKKESADYVVKSTEPFYPAKGSREKEKEGKDYIVTDIDSYRPLKEKTKELKQLVSHRDDVNEAIDFIEDIREKKKETKQLLPYLDDVSEKQIIPYSPFEPSLNETVTKEGDEDSMLSETDSTIQSVVPYEPIKQTQTKKDDYLVHSVETESPKVEFELRPIKKQTKDFTKTREKIVETPTGYLKIVVKPPVVEEPNDVQLSPIAKYGYVPLQQPENPRHTQERESLSSKRFRFMKERFKDLE